MNKEYLTWVAFYTEFAEKLLPYAKDRQTLIEKIKAVYTAQPVKEARLRVCNLASCTIERRKKVSATTYGLRAFSNSSQQI